MTNHPDLIDTNLRARAEWFLDVGSIAAAGAGRAGPDLMTEGQWTVYFWLELCSIWPQVPVAQVPRLARAICARSICIEPELAAAAIALGLDGISLH